MGSSCCVGDFIFNCGYNHPIRDFFDSLCSDCCVGHSSGPTESEKHARKVANELAEMKEKSEQSSKDVESKIMKYINSSLDSFMEEIEDINKQSFFGEKLNINTTAIREKNDALNEQVVGCVSTVMNTRLVQTDKELSTILEERDDKKRKKNFEDFTDKVKKQALSKLKVQIEKTVNAQSEVVSAEIKIRQKEINYRLEETIRELTEILDVKKKNDEELEKKQVSIMYESALCDLLLAEVGR